jgi:hypothetical protein
MNDTSPEAERVLTNVFRGMSALNVADLLLRARQESGA